MSSIPITHTFSSTTVQQKAAEFTTNFLVHELKKNPVFLLISGGSGIPMCMEMFELLAKQLNDLSNLTVSLFDERFVVKGTADSNEEQSRAIGIVDLLQKHHAKWIPYLNEENISGPETAKHNNQKFDEEIHSGKKIIVVAGIGDDGHTSGLIPTKNSEVIQTIFGSKKNIEYYELPEDALNPFRKRLTTTPYFIQKIDQVIVYSTGDKKKKALQRFMANNESETDCPCLILKTSKSPVILISDQEL